MRKYAKIHIKQISYVIRLVQNQQHTCGNHNNIFHTDRQTILWLNLNHIVKLKLNIIPKKRKVY